MAEKSGYNFFNYLQTAIRYPLRDAFRFLSKHQKVSMDDPFGDGKANRGDTMSNDDYEGDSSSNYDISNIPDDEKYAPEVGEQIYIILKLNIDRIFN